MKPAVSLGRSVRGSAAVVAFLLILAPILIVVVAAFSPTDYFEFPPPGLSLRWFVEFFRLDNMRNAFVLSLELALLSGTIAAVLGTMGALFLARRRGVMAGLLHSLFLAPLVFPTIILGLALLLLYKSVGLPVFPGLVLAHCVIGMPYCFRTDLAGRRLGLAVRLCRLVRRIEHGPVLERTGIDDAADRDLQLPAISGQPAGNRGGLDAADRADRGDGDGSRTDSRHGPHHPVALTRSVRRAPSSTKSFDQH